MATLIGGEGDQTLNVIWKYLHLDLVHISIYCYVNEVVKEPLKYICSAFLQILAHSA